MAEVSNAVGFDLDQGRILPGSPIVAGTSADIAERLTGILASSGSEPLSEQIDRLYGQICVETVVPLPGVRSALRELQIRGYSLGIATNDAGSNERSQMETLGMISLFEKVLGADSGYGQKPGPGMIQAFADKTSLNASEIMMVGDSLHDLESAKAAGAFSCAVLTGPAGRKELMSHADIVIDSVVDLPAWLEKTGSV